MRLLRKRPGAGPRAPSACAAELVGLPRASQCRADRLGWWRQALRPCGEHESTSQTRCRGVCCGQAATQGPGGPVLAPGTLARRCVGRSCLTRPVAQIVGWTPAACSRRPCVRSTLLTVAAYQRPPLSAPSIGGVPAVPRYHRRHCARARRASHPRQLRDAQDRADPSLVGEAAAVTPAFHAHRRTRGSIWWSAGSRCSPTSNCATAPHRSTTELECAIRQNLAISNEQPKPFVWTKTADQIFESLKRFLSANFRLRTLERREASARWGLGYRCRRDGQYLCQGAREQEPEAPDCLERQSHPGYGSSIIDTSLSAS